MNWTGRIIVLLLLAVIIGVPVVMKTPRDSAARVDPDDPNRLVIISPHNEQIRFEVSHAFNRWRKSQGKPTVAFDWRSSGGTSDLRRQVIAEYEAEARRALSEGREIKGVGYDLFFGGGEYEHNKFAREMTVTERVTRGGESKEESIRFHIGVPVQMPDGMLEAIFPTPDIAGAALYNPERRWMGVVLASFGIVYNRDEIHAMNQRFSARHTGSKPYVPLAEPKTWTDLTDPRYRGLIALADPAHSGSITEAYNAILQRLGWNEGWAVLRRIYANAKTFAAVSTQVSMEISSGDCAAGMTIDFYGRFQSGVVGPAASVEGPRLGYVDPAGMTKVNADPITILLGAPHAELANEFVLWLLSKDGQRIWQTKLGEEHGPVRFELRRQPVRRDLYTPEEMKHWTDPENPFELSKPFAPGMPDMYSTVATVAHATAIDVHHELVEAWKAIQTCKDETKKAKLLAMFDRMPPELTLEGLPENWLAILEDAGHPEHDAIADKLKAFVDGVKARWKDKDQQLRDRLKWTAFFNENYKAIVRAAEE